MKTSFSYLLSVLALVVFVGAGCAGEAPVAAPDVPADAEEAPMEDMMDEEMKTMEESTEPIQVGWMGPLTGDVANIGTAMRDAVELAVKELNAEGGIDGRDVNVLYEDGKCDAKQANTAANKLLNVDNVVALLGGVCSGESLAAAPLVNEKQRVMISAASTAPDLSEAGDYFFRVVPSDAYQGRFAAQYAQETLGHQKVAVLHALTDYTQGIADVFAQAFEELGGEVVVKDTFIQGSKDLRTQLTKVKNSDAEFVYFVAYTESAIVGLRQMQELGLDLPVLGGDTFADPAVHEAEGAEGVQFVQAYTADRAAFTEKYLAETGRDDEPAYVAQQYDAANVLFNVLKEAGTEGEALRDALANTEYKGVSGNIEFDPNGDLQGAKYSVLRIENGTGVVVE